MVGKRSMKEYEKLAEDLEETIALLDMIHADYFIKLSKLKETNTDSLIVNKLELDAQFLLVSACLDNLKAK